MKPRLTIRLDDDTQEDLRRLALRKKTSVAALVRYALDKTFENDLDDISSRRALEEAVRDPSSTISLEEYKKFREEAARG